MHRPYRALAFAAVLTSLAGLTLAISCYRVAVANAYLRLPVPERPEAAPTAPVDLEAAYRRGSHLVALIGCTDCHGQNLAGKRLVDDANFLLASAPNLTPSATGHVHSLDDARLRRVLRYGVDGEWRVLWWMPRRALQALANSDVEALRVYVQRLRPVDHVLPQSHLGLWGYMQVALRRLNLVDRTPLTPPPPLPKSLRIDDAQADAMLPAADWLAEPPRQGDAQFGSYLAAVGRCTSCHGPQRGTARPPDAPHARSLQDPTFAGAGFAAWDRGLRAGPCPDGASEAERGAPSRMHALSQEESLALFKAWTQ